MIFILTPIAVLLASVSRIEKVGSCRAEDYYYQPGNESTSLSGIAAYRSALTLDWLAAEDQRQRELAAAFETEPAPPSRALSTDCISYPRPASGKVARLMLELLKNLEGDEGTIVNDLIQALIRTKLLVETSMLESEPDLESLVKTPGVMMGEPHTTFPRILAMTWMTVTDPVTTKKFGWCHIMRVNKYLAVSKSMMVAKQMKALEPVIARARFIMEEFIQHVTPLNMYQKNKLNAEDLQKLNLSPAEVSVTSAPPPMISTEFRPHHRRPTRTPGSVRAVHVALAQASTPLLEAEPIPNIIRGDDSVIVSTAHTLNLHPFVILAVIVIVV